MHYRAALDIYNIKNKLIKERVIYIRADSIVGAMDIVHKIRGARWWDIMAIDLKTYQNAVADQI